MTRTARGVVRLLNTAGGRVLYLAGQVDAGVVDAHLRRYGREPMPVDAIDAGSVTGLSLPALDRRGAAHPHRPARPLGDLEVVLDHLQVAERAGRPVRVRRSPTVERLLGEREPQQAL